jgi:SNF2 family DNA or RNA helicase
MNKIIRAGVRTKVLMLSATPVNNRFNDLKNQLQLAYEGESARLDALLNTESSVDDIFRKAQRSYNEWSRLPKEERTTKQLLSMLSFDFFTLLDSVTIARSRKHIEQYYDTADIGKFPTRLKPISRRPPLTDLNTAINYNEIFEQLQQLNLAVYTPSAFILDSRKDKYGIDTEDEITATGHRLSIEDREKGIRRLMSIQMLKRLESSVNSFRLTVQRIAAYIDEMLKRIDNHMAQTEVDNYMIATEPAADWDIEDADNDIIIGRRKNKILLADLDYMSWRTFLQKDADNLKLLLLMLADITPEHDSKLQQLIADLRDKFANPINEGNKKVIIFTAFSDTAEYLYKNLAPAILEKHGLHTALVSGDVEARSTLKLREKLDFNKVLTLFSPVSKEKSAIYPKLDAEIDVLIGTDCISEGQNLQDCDYLINYDIHWNPVRIIQRFGRIDRIGSRNAVIQLVNYWPDMTLDEYINLKERVEARMKASVLTATGDGNPLSENEKDDLDYRRQQLKRLQEEVVDIEEMNTGVSIMDLGLNEFRLDLLEYINQGHDIEHTPFGLHAVVKAKDGTTPGVVFVLKNRNGGINIDHKKQLHPFYMVYISDEGEVVVNHLAPKDLLDRLRMLCKGVDTPDKILCRAFNKEPRDGRNMKRYSELLGEAINSIINVKQESDIDSFLGGVQGSLFAEPITGLDDFELICFLVIK